MAKEVKVGIKFDDNGSLKETGKKGKQAGKDLEKGAKGAHSMDRRLKGAAGASSNSTKNFSKMSQGISGGLVPAYATLAASLFAVDAAFQALKRASDLRVQSEGMTAYAQSTGVALKSVARDLQAATGYQLDFKEAAESTSIAIAAGFSADQVTQIGVAAKQASIALGRDFADSYQRLLKGITKAEPELLDELGIILRLEKATTDYGAAIGKNAKDLTAYERQQAVFNETIGQVAEKYAAVGDGIAVNQFGQLGAVLTDITDNALKGIAPIAEFFAGVFVNNTNAAIAALGVFAASILKQVVPSFTQLKIEAGQAWVAMKQSASGVGSSFSKAGSGFKGAYNTLTQTPAMGQADATAMAKGDLSGVKSAGMKQLRKGGALSGPQRAGLARAIKNAELQYKKHGKITTGIFAGTNIKVVRNFSTSMKVMQGRGFITFKALGMSFKAMGSGMMATAKLVGFGMKTMYSGMVGGAKIAGAAMTKALGIIGMIGMIVMFMGTIKEMMNNLDQILRKIGELTQKIGGLISRFGKFLGFEGKLGDLITNQGTNMVKKADAMKPAYDKKRDKAAAGKKAEALTTSITENTGEIKEIVAGWKGMGDKFDSTRAKAQLLAGNSGLGKLQKHIAMTKDTTGAYTGQLDESRKALVAHYTELAKLDPEYDAIANMLGGRSSEMTEEARKRVVKLTNAYGSHVQALKDMKSAEEGRSKRLSEIALKTRVMTQNGIEMVTLQQSMSALIGDKTTQKDLEQFYDFFGLDSTDKIYTQGEALAYVNEELRKRKELVSDSVAARLAVGAGAVTQAGYASSPSLMRGQASKDQALLVSRSKLADAEVAYSSSMSDNQSARKGITDESKLQELDDLAAGYLNIVNAQRESTAQLEAMNTQMGELKMTAMDAFVNGMQKGLEGLVNGTMNAKQAFKQMALSILKDMASMIAKQMILNLLMGTAMGDMMGLETKGGAKNRSGGIMSSPGYRSYDKGGVASGPRSGYGATLHGTEAIVPLPGDRKIPVELSGKGLGGNHNTTVNVNMEGGSSVTSDEETGKALGMVIQAAVTQEIADQQRPGGLLSPLGGGG